MINLFIYIIVIYSDPDFYICPKGVVTSPSYFSFDPAELVEIPRRKNVRATRAALAAWATLAALVFYICPYGVVASPSPFFAFAPVELVESPR